jgi:methionyl-tRNA formyltransferase
MTVLVASRPLFSLMRAAASLSSPLATRASNRSLLHSPQLRTVSSCAGESIAPFSILFFGTDSFSLPTLALLASSPSLASHISVMCPQDAPSGRGMKTNPCIVKQFALQHSLPVVPSLRFSFAAPADCAQVHHPAQRRSMRDTPVPHCPSSSDGRWHVGVVVSFGFFIPARFISSFTLGAINGHPSLLPRYRGPAPLTHTLLNDDSKSGVCVIDVSSAAFDVGSVLLKSEVTVPPTALYPEFRAAMAERTAQSIATVLADLQSFRSRAVSQASLEPFHGAPSSAPKVSKAEALIDPAATPVRVLMCKYRAFHGSLGTSLLLNEPQKRRVSVDLVLGSSTWGEGSSQHLLQAAASAVPGSAILDKGGKCVWLRCADGWAAAQRFTVEGKKSCDAVAFANGFGVSSSQARQVFMTNIAAPCAHP